MPISLQSCTTGGCVDSAPIEVAPTLVEAIGFFKASNAQGEDYFGRSIALAADGKTLVAAASWEDSDAIGINDDQTSDPSFNYIKASNTDGGDHFGSKVALSANGDTLAIGAMLERSASPGINGDQTDNSLSLAGAVYVFECAGQDWAQQAYIKASNPGAFAPVRLLARALAQRRHARGRGPLPLRGQRGDGHQRRPEQQRRERGRRVPVRARRRDLAAVGLQPRRRGRLPTGPR